VSNAVFPSLPGMKLPSKRPNFATMIQRGVSGYEVRASNMLYPIWDFLLEWDVLRDDRSVMANVAPAAPLDELRKIRGFFEAHRGSFESFLFDDPTDNDVSAQQFGVGDGSTTAFQLLRTAGVGQTFAEPVANLNGAPQIFRSDWQGNQLMYATPRTNLATFSEQLDNAAWVKSRASVTPDATTSPDGNITADKLVEDTTASNSHVIQAAMATTAANASLVGSIHAKAAERSWIRLWCIDSTALNHFNRYFNLVTGALGTASTGGTGVLAGSGVVADPATGWYRPYIAGNLGSGITQMRLRVDLATGDNGGAYTGDGVSGAYLWGADLKQDTVLSSYIQTPSSASATVTDYTLDSKGLITFASAPLLGALLTWTGAYYYRARFARDLVDLEQFMKDLYQLRQVQLRASLGSKI
jgi:hypothetical protein